MAPADRAKGLVAASAGNHAQAVAFHAGRLGVSATIVMPEATPLLKVVNTRGHGARVVLHGSNYEEAYAEARRLEQVEGLTFVHPFDDPAVIAGQGTVALELLEQVPDLEAVLVPVGGGGLISGMAVALKARLPHVRVDRRGERGASRACSPRWRRGAWSRSSAATTVADGIAVKRPGEITFQHVQKYVDEIVTVSEEEIASAILYLLEKEKTVAEGAGAVAVAALLNHKVPGLEGKRVVAVVSGGNIDVNVIARVIERGLAKEGRLVRVIVAPPRQAGTARQGLGGGGEPPRERHRGAPHPRLLAPLRRHHAPADPRDARPRSRRGDPARAPRARLPGGAGVTCAGDKPPALPPPRSASSEEPEEQRQHQAQDDRGRHREVEPEVPALHPQVAR